MSEDTADPRRMSKPITVKEEREMLLLDPDPDKTKLEAALEDNALYSINIDAFFKGEIIRSDQSFMMKLESLFHGVRVRSAKVTRIGDRTEYQAVVDKDAFLSLIRHNSYGVFRGDYKLEITDFCVNEGDIIVTPESPLKLAPAKKEVDGLDQELTITMRRGKEPTDRPAPGMQTFNLMTDPNEVFRILEHFELEGKVTRCTKATPQRPTLQIRLTDSVEKLFTEEYHKEPCLVYNPSPQSVATGATQLWAHMHISSQNLPKRVVIEGIDGLVDLEEVKHRLSYQGEVISDLEKMVWKDPQMRFTNVANGDICVFMKIRVEFNYLLFGRDSYKVSYQNQPLQCSICYSFSHRATSCDKRHIGRATLHFDYLSKWKRQVGFIERRSRHRSSSSSESPDRENSSGDDGSNESDGEPDAKSLDDTVVNNQGRNAQEAQTENDLRSSVGLISARLRRYWKSSKRLMKPLTRKSLTMQTRPSPLMRMRGRNRWMLKRMVPPKRSNQARRPLRYQTSFQLTLRTRAGNRSSPGSTDRAEALAMILTRVTTPLRMLQMQRLKKEQALGLKIRNGNLTLPRRTILNTPALAGRKLISLKKPNRSSTSKETRNTTKRLTLAIRLSRKRS